MPWHKVSLSNEQIEQQQALLNLEKQFEQVYINAGGPEGMALFSDNDYQDGKISIYFTPDCSPSCDNIISQHGGEACDTPSVDHVFLLTGNDDAEDLLEEQ